VEQEGQSGDDSKEFKPSSYLVVILFGFEFHGRWLGQRLA
jgi:hypothetical protein